MIKHLEIKTYEYCGINVTVKIDYHKKQISLVEADKNHQTYNNRAYYFAGRELLEYIKGWKDILEAMKYAMEESAKELKEYLDLKEKERMDDTTKILMAATDMVVGQKKR
jgi:hypothetical protein